MDIPDEIKNAIHGLNADAFKLNKGIVQKSATMQEIPMSKEIYGNPSPQPQPQVQPQPQPQQFSTPVSQQLNTDPALLNSLIERVSAVEKQITKFVNLIERQISRNSKEINIRIKLDNDSTNKE